MDASVTLDHLIGNSNGVTLWFHNETCSLSLIREAILRGFQVRDSNPKSLFSYGCGMCEGSGSPHGDGGGPGINDSQDVSYPRYLQVCHWCGLWKLNGKWKRDREGNW